MVGCPSTNLSLAALQCNRFLPRATQIIGYARTALTDEGLRERLVPYLKGDEEAIQKFLKLCCYLQGDVSAAYL